MTLDRVAAVVLAAGKGTRMKSSCAKVLHELFFAPMIYHVLDALVPLGLAKTVVVVGHRHEEVAAAIAPYEVEIAIQEEQIGTGHAVLTASPLLRGSSLSVLILCGDTPLIRAETLEALCRAHLEADADCTLLTTTVQDASGYGRILSDGSGRLLGIVEEKDASPEERKISEINSGIYCVKEDFLFEALSQVGRANAQGEMYLTDIVAIAVKGGKKVQRFSCPDPDEVLGVNSRVELARAHELLQLRRNLALMESGVTMIHPETIAVEKGVEIGPDTVIEPNVTIRGESRIGESCRIGAFSMLVDCSLADRVEVGPFSFIAGCGFSSGEQIPPHSRLTQDY